MPNIALYMNGVYRMGICLYYAMAATEGALSTFFVWAFLCFAGGTLSNGGHVLLGLKPFPEKDWISAVTTVIAILVYDFCIGHFFF